MATIYVVNGSEDGVIGVATSARKAVRMAIDYVAQCESDYARVLESFENELARSARRDGVTLVSTAGLRGVTACSDCVSAEIVAFDPNYANGSDY